MSAQLVPYVAVRKRRARLDVEIQYVVARYYQLSRRQRHQFRHLLRLLTDGAR
jgi:hypothetical protein